MSKAKKTTIPAFEGLDLSRKAPRDKALALKLAEETRKRIAERTRMWQKNDATIPRCRNCGARR